MDASDLPLEDDRRQTDRRKTDQTLEYVLTLTEAATAAVSETSMLREEVAKLDKATVMRIDAVTKAAQARADEAKSERRREFRLVVVLVIFAVLLTLVGLFTYRTLSHVDSCINPHGKCHVKSQKETDHAVANIVDEDHDGIPDTIELRQQIAALTTEVDQLKAQGGKP